MLESLVKNEPSNIAVRATLRSEKKKLHNCTNSSPVSTPAESEVEDENVQTRENKTHKGEGKTSNPNCSALRSERGAKKNNIKKRKSP